MKALPSTDPPVRQCVDDLMLSLRLDDLTAIRCVDDLTESLCGNVDDLPASVCVQEAAL